MRKAAIVEALVDAIQYRIDDRTVSEKFDLTNLDAIAEHIRDATAFEWVTQANDVWNIVETTWIDTDDKTRDRLADGEIADPNAWLLDRIKNR